MKGLKNYIKEKLVINKSFPIADQYKDDNGNITIKNYESFQYWLNENNIEYEVLDAKDKRNNFDNDAKCIISVSFSDKHIKKNVALIYTFINASEFFWSYFIDDDCVYEPSSSSNLDFGGDTSFKETLEKRRDPISYFKELIDKANRNRIKCLKGKLNRRTGERNADYYGAQTYEAKVKKYEKIISQMK